MTRELRWQHPDRPLGPIVMWLHDDEDPHVRLRGLLDRVPNLPRDGWVLDGSTHWRQRRVYCAACAVTRSVVTHPDADLRCPTCGGPVIRDADD